MLSSSTAYYCSTLYWPRSDEGSEWRWKDFLITALPQVEYLRDMYQIWVKLTEKEQLKCRQLITEILFESDEAATKRYFRITRAIINTYDEWSTWQDQLGACGFSSDLIVLTENFERDITYSLNGLRRAIRNATSDTISVLLSTHNVEKSLPVPTKQESPAYPVNKIVSQLPITSVGKTTKNMHASPAPTRPPSPANGLEDGLDFSEIHINETDLTGDNLCHLQPTFVNANTLLNSRIRSKDNSEPLERISPLDIEVCPDLEDIPDFGISAGTITPGTGNSTETENSDAETSKSTTLESDSSSNCDEEESAESSGSPSLVASASSSEEEHQDKENVLPKILVSAFTNSN